MPTTLTPVDCYGDWWAKRDDRAAATGPDDPAGSKVRQFARMVAAHPDRPVVVGCSGESCMQVYAASAAFRAGVPCHIFTAKRAEPSSATTYAVAHGAVMHLVTPGYLSVIRTRAREYVSCIGGAVRWDTTGAVRDAAQQTANLPADVRRVVIPTGSGLTAAGVMAGLASAGRMVPVLAVCVSEMATDGAIRDIANGAAGGEELPPLTTVRAPDKYGHWRAARLPNGDYLDPYYAAKALRYIELGDVLWVPGVRPLSALPDGCGAALGRTAAGTYGDGGRK